MDTVGMPHVTAEPRNSHAKRVSLPATSKPKLRPATWKAHCKAVARQIEARGKAYDRELAIRAERHRHLPWIGTRKNGVRYIKRLPWMTEKKRQEWHMWMIYGGRKPI